MRPKLGCIIRQEAKAAHAGLTVSARQLLPAWSRQVEAPRILGHNDTIADCATVAAVNAVQTRLAILGNYTPLPDDLPVQIYSAVTGYDAKNPITDQGTDPERLFAWWLQNAIGPYKLRSFVRLNPANIQAVKNAIAMLGAYICVELADDQIGATEWRAEAPNPSNGHAAWADEYIADRVNATSWGKKTAIYDDMLARQGAMVYSLSLVTA